MTNAAYLRALARRIEQQVRDSNTSTRVLNLVDNEDAKRLDEIARLIETGRNINVTNL